jgi:uncharacterized protein (TIGR03083 family)
MADLIDLIAAERTDFTDFLTEFTPAQWDAPSLCAGWRTREVIAHLSLPFRHSAPPIMWQLLKARGNFHVVADKFARADADKLSTAQLVASLRDNARNPWSPPGGGLDATLTHDIVHGLDITVAQGLDREPPAERLTVALTNLAHPKRHKFFGLNLAGVQFRADDRDWTYGVGEPVTGTAATLVLVLAGRKVPAERLAGKSAQFVA